MSFTLAHPAAVLPLWRCRWVFFPAAVIGSLSPDFVYFLLGRASSGVGHSWWGLWLLNLPLCWLVFALYWGVWRGVLQAFLPNPLNAALPLTWQWSWRFVLIFSGSALLGMLTHIIWDDFTHASGFFVQRLPLLQQRFFGLAGYKWLQHGGGILGIAACLSFIWQMAKRFPSESKRTTADKIRFWTAFCLMSMMIWAIWWWQSPLHLRELATAVIRAIDSTLITLTLAGLWWKKR